MKKTFTILDGSWFVFRAYYGMPPLEDEQWRPVQAIFGFFRMLFKLMQQKPDYFAIARDSPQQTIRKEQFSEYKANRTKLPDEFKYQMWSIKKIVEECNIPFFEAPGYEADDIIGTLVNPNPVLSGAQGDLCYKIVSSDKDLKQLITENITVYDGMKDEETNLERFRLEYDYEPLLIVDFLSLVWDASDNIKWVPGIGKKWAEKLVKQYGDLDNIYAHLDEITWSTKTKLEDWKTDAYNSKALIQLMAVPTLTKVDVENTKFSLDFSHMESVLVDKRKFSRLQKSIKELKKEVDGGKQLGLFG